MKSCTYVTMIHVKYTSEFFENFYILRSRGAMLEVSKSVNLL